MQQVSLPEIPGGMPFLPPGVLLLTDRPDLAAGLHQLPADSLVLSIASLDVIRQGWRHLPVIAPEALRDCLTEHGRPVRHVRVLTDLGGSTPLDQSSQQGTSSLVALHAAAFLTLQASYNELSADGASFVTLLLGAMPDGVPHAYTGQFSGLAKCAKLEMTGCLTFVLCTSTQDVDKGVRVAERETTACRQAPAVSEPDGTRSVYVFADDARLAPPADEFLTDLRTLQERVRANIERGPVRSASSADLDRLLAVLNDTVTAEIMCMLRDRQHYSAMTGLQAGPAAAEFLARAAEEQTHAYALAARIAQLDGIPGLDRVARNGRARSQHRARGGLLAMVTESLIAKRVTIEWHADIVAWLGTVDPTTRRILATILANEEEDAQHMLAFLRQMS